jgi:hypothetical protein
VSDELHVAREPYWFDDGPEITLDEWIAVVKQRAEMHLDGFAEAETRDTQARRNRLKGESDSVPAFVPWWRGQPTGTVMVRLWLLLSVLVLSPSCVCCRDRCWHQNRQQAGRLGGPGEAVAPAHPGGAQGLQSDAAMEARRTELQAEVEPYLKRAREHADALLQRARERAEEIRQRAAEGVAR